MIPAIGMGPLGAAEWSVGSISGAPGAQLASAQPTASTGAASFGNALSNAIGSLDASQNTASTAATQLATGQATDPSQAVTAVENASLSMDYASQIRNQLTSAATTLFQTQM